MHEEIACGIMIIWLVGFFTSFLSSPVFTCIMTATLTLVMCLLFACAIERSLKKKRRIKRILGEKIK